MPTQGPTPPIDQERPNSDSIPFGGYGQLASPAPNYEMPPSETQYGRAFNADTCALAQMTVEYRASYDVRPEPEGEGLRRAQLISMHPIGGSDPAAGFTPINDPRCRYHRGYTGYGPRGRRRAIVCSGASIVGTPDVAPSPGTTFGRLSVRATEDTLGRAGRARVLTAYRTPENRAVLLVGPRCQFPDYDPETGVWLCGTSG